MAEHSTDPEERTGLEVAIVGLAGRFPGAGDVGEFWTNLRAGVESISFFSRDELLEDGVDPALVDDPAYVPARGVLRDPDHFDAGFFDLTPRDAEVLNPQHRILLECAWEALESAGYDPARLGRPVGVFAGSSTSSYILNLLASPEVVQAVGVTRVNLGNDKDHLAAGISYRLDLRGPSFSVQTACSTSLVAVHLACQSLINGECDLALAGGVSAGDRRRAGYLYSPDGISSPDGHCRAFDARARGSVGGSGAGVVVLKRLEEALADGDTVHAVIRGSAINNDGAEKVGYTAPSVAGQARVISEALSVAGVDPATIQYVETHGTGTPLGDAIELRALKQVFARGGEGEARCALGSVKTNVGHLDAAAGVAGLIKATLSLRHGEVPPSLHCETPNPELEEGGPLFVNSRLRPWERSGAPRRAGVSSFGIGGTNAHVVLEEAPAPEPSGPSRPFQLLPVSARSAAALRRSAERLAAHLEGSAPELADAAYTLQVGRRAMEHRAAVVCGDLEEAVAALRRVADAAGSPPPVRGSGRPVAFMFPGVGMQYPGMGRGLYRSEPVFRAAVDECCDLLEPLLGADLRETLFAADGEDAGAEQEGWDLRRLLGRGGEGDPASGPLARTRLAQPAVFVVGYALARLWTAWGVRPRALIGHSLGEYLAACVAGVFRLEDALRLVAERARLIDALPRGAMLAVPLPEDELRALLPDGVDLAAVNAPGSCVASGPIEGVEALEALLAGRGVVSRRLPARQAFHSRAMEPVAAELEALLGRVELRAPEIPFVSNVTGTWISEEQARSPRYWARHLCEPVRFADGLAALRAESDWVLLEVGPGQSLGAWAVQRPGSGAAGDPAVLSSLRHPGNRVPDPLFLLRTLGQLWTAGVEVDWAAYGRGERRRRIPLPTYPFERRRYWVEPRHRNGREAPGGRNGAAPRNGADEQGSNVIEKPQPAGEAAAQDAPDRRGAILDMLRAVATRLTGIPAEDLATDVHFFQAGIDSLLLLQAIQAIEKETGVRVSLVELLEEVTTLDALAAHLDATLPPEAFAPPPAEPEPAPAEEPVPVPVGAQLPAATAASPRAAAPPAAESALERVIGRQLELMAQQIAALRGEEPAGAPAPAPAAPAAPPPVPAPAVARSPRARHQPETFVPFQPLNTERPGGLTPGQKEYLDDFVARYAARTARSKAHQQRFHLPLADGRVTARFRRIWKEISYPIVGERAAGSRVRDLDGNEYVDIAMGYGCNLFGHAPDFVSRAIQEQVEAGYGVGPQSPLAGRVAELVCELGGNDRAVFCNSGTEAVMGAIRAARTYTGRDRIAYFSGSYHGWSDPVLGRVVDRGGKRELRPSAPGIPASHLQDVLMLEYDDPASLETLAEQLHDIAVVLVEPVQSRRPDIQPREFLHELRRITREAGTLLLFDELVTGFRLLPGGAQALFGVEADLVTYGKVVAGGLPMGVVAGRREVMDVFDGGTWRFGDDSYPLAQRTFFAGAFFKHPLAMGVAHALMEEVRRQGAPMYEALNRRTAELVRRLNDMFEEERFPVSAVHCGSIFRFFLGSGIRFPELFPYHLVHNGVHMIPETGTCFLSTAHSDEDLERIFAAVRTSLRELRRGGFVPAPPEGGAGPQASSRDGEAGTAEAPAAAGPEAVPLTPGQRQLWIESQMGEAAALAYVESSSLHLRGALDAPALERALQALVDRHDVLRATFGPEGDVQLIHPRVSVEVPRVDFSHLPGDERDDRLRAWLRREVRRPFDLVAGPLVRFALAVLAPEHHLLVASFHHAVMDGWSFGILLRELGALYLAGKEGRAPELPPPPRYAEFAREQGAARGAAGDGTAEAFWLGEFADGVPVLSLPTDRPRPTVRGYRGERLERTLDAGLMGPLGAVCRANGFSLFNVLVSAFCAWVGRLAGQEDLVVGVPSAGQAGGAGAAGLVGYNINVLPLRTRPEASLPFVEHARRVRRGLLLALEHQGFSFQRLVERLAPARDPSRPPLFSVMFNVDRDDGTEALLGDLRLTGESNFGGGAKFDLNVNVTERPGGLRVYCDYDTDLFDAATVEGWLASFERLLAGIGERPDAPLGALPLLADGERRRMLEAWNATDAPYPYGATLTELWEAQAARTPDAAALLAGERTVRFAELEERANRLARFLQARGVGPESRVGVLLDRSPELVTAVLGILKAGGAYLPLDPAHPAGRLAHMLADAGAALVVTDAAHRDALPADPSRAVVCLDGDAAAVSAMEATPPARLSTPDSLAYVLYTSGSTGLPRGIGGLHRSTVNRCAWMWEAFPFQPGEVCVHKTAIGFVDFVWELFGPLLRGVPSVVVPDGVAGDPLRFVEALERHGVTRLVLVPSLLRALLTEPELVARLGGLRCCVSSGERLPPELCEAFLALLPGCRLLNLYGSTEVAADVTWEEVRRADLPLVPIGRPVANTRIYLLDGGMSPVPVGVAGRLYAGGAGVARGYVGRPDLTAERFVPDPFSPAPGARLYDTGDLARYRADGRIEYLGRRDAQVKVRGHRIEPAEVESALREYPGVGDALVQARPARDGAHELVAYVEAAAGAAGDGGLPPSEAARHEAQLRAFLAGRLPAYMVPDRLVLVGALPRLPNGKVDRLSLPDPATLPRAALEHVEPEGETESVLAEIWREVLGVPRVGRYDGFFALGGNSLSAIRLLSRIRARLGAELGMPDLFRAPTLSAMAGAVEAVLVTSVSDLELAELLGQLELEAG